MNEDMPLLSDFATGAMMVVLYIFQLYCENDMKFTMKFHVVMVFWSE
jgi:hypothetical protein